MEYEYPIVHTIYSLQQVYRNELRESSYEHKIDLGYNIPIFDFNPYSIGYIQQYEVVATTDYYLTLLANAYKWVDNYLLTKLLKDKAYEIRQRSLGSVISHYDYVVEQAIINKDTKEVKPNKTVRWLPNPTYRKQPEQDIDQYSIINTILGQETRDENFTKIYNASADYDLNGKTFYKCVLADKASLSTRTISTYLKEYPELNEVFEAVKQHSGTEEQKRVRGYYNRKAS